MAPSWFRPRTSRAVRSCAAPVAGMLWRAARQPRRQPAVDRARGPGRACAERRWHCSRSLSRLMTAGSGSQAGCGRRERVERRLCLRPGGRFWTTGPTLPEAGPSLGARQHGERSARRRLRGSTFDRRRRAVRRLDDGAEAPGPTTRRSRAARRGSRGVGRIAHRLRGRRRAGQRRRARCSRLEDGAWSQVARLASPREHLAVTSDGEGRTFVRRRARRRPRRNLATADRAGEATARRSASCRRERGGVGAFWWPTLGACLVGGESPAARTPRSSASTRTATSRCCQVPHARGTGWVPRSSTAWPTSRSAAISRAVCHASTVGQWSCPDGRPWRTQPGSYTTRVPRGLVVARRRRRTGRRPDPPP